MSRDAKKKKPDPAGPLVKLKTAAFTFETALSHQCTSVYLSIYPSIYLSIHPSIYLSIYLSEKTTTVKRTNTARRREGPSPGSLQHWTYNNSFGTSCGLFKPPC